MLTFCAGLLAGLWEFPNILFGENRDNNSSKEKNALEKDLLSKEWGVKSPKCQAQFVSEVPHIFSHIRQLYVVYSLTLLDKIDVPDKREEETKWMNSDEILSSAISTAMKKVRGK